MLTNTQRHYPGTRQHQAILRAIVAYYENDPRILTVAVFGSLGRGNWDQYSDIDLDVVIADQVTLDAIEELTWLCLSFGTLGEHGAVIIPDGTLGHTLPQYSLISAQESLGRCVDISEYDLGHLTNEQIQLPDAYRKVLKAVRARQAHLNFSG